MVTEFIKNAHLLLVEFLLTASLLKSFHRLAIARSPPLGPTVRIDLRQRLLGIANLTMEERGHITEPIRTQSQRVSQEIPTSQTGIRASPLTTIRKI